MFIKIITIFIVLWLLTRVSQRWRHREITAREAALWAALWGGVGVVVLYPQLADRLAAAIGLQSATGIDLVVYVAVAVAFYLVFRIFVRLERLEHNITKVVKEIALREEIKKP